MTTPLGVFHEKTYPMRIDSPNDCIKLEILQNITSGPIGSN